MKTFEYQIGDTVRILDSDHCYRNYGEFLNAFPELQCKYRHGATIGAGTIGTITAMGVHPYNKRTLVLVEDGVGVFIFDQLGVELIARNAMVEVSIDPHAPIIDLALHTLMGYLITAECAARDSGDHALEKILSERIIACDVALAHRVK